MGGQKFVNSPPRQPVWAGGALTRRPRWMVPSGGWNILAGLRSPHAMGEGGLPEGWYPFSPRKRPSFRSLNCDRHKACLSGSRASNPGSSKSTCLGLMCCFMFLLFELGMRAPKSCRIGASPSPRADGEVRPVLSSAPQIPKSESPFWNLLTKCVQRGDLHAP